MRRRRGELRFIMMLCFCLLKFRRESLSEEMCGVLNERCLFESTLRVYRRFLIVLIIVCVSLPH